MNTNTDYILEHLGSEASEEMVYAEFGGLSQAEILAKLNEWFPADDNEKLSEMIADYVK